MIYRHYAGALHGQIHGQVQSTTRPQFRREAQQRPACVSVAVDDAPCAGSEVRPGGGRVPPNWRWSVRIPPTWPNGLGLTCRGSSFLTLFKAAPAGPLGLMAFVPAELARGVRLAPIPRDGNSGERTSGRGANDESTGSGPLTPGVRGLPRARRRRPHRPAAPRGRAVWRPGRGLDDRSQWSHRRR
jgi:hypothetical protein